MTTDIEERLSDLELWKTQIEISRAREDVEKKHIDLRFDSIESKLSDINSTAKKLTYSILSTVIVYLITFVMSGGLSILKTGG